MFIAVTTVKQKVGNNFQEITMKHNCAEKLNTEKSEKLLKLLKKLMKIN